MTRQLSTLAEGRLVLALEGGYNERVISECSVACISVRLAGGALVSEA